MLIKDVMYVFEVSDITPIAVLNHSSGKLLLFSTAQGILEVYGDSLVVDVCRVGELIIIEI